MFILKECTLKSEDIDNLYKSIGQNVKKYREESGLTQLDLALLIGHKSVGTVSTAELYTNRKHFNLEHLAKIANVLDKDIRDLLDT